MAVEIKKRLLLSKWRGYFETGRDGDDEFERVLTEVKYAMHDGIVPAPRRLLRQIEEALG